MKKLGIVFVTLVLALVVSGCSNQEGSTEGQRDSRPWQPLVWLGERR